MCQGILCTCWTRAQTLFQTAVLGPPLPQSLPTPPASLPVDRFEECGIPSACAQTPKSGVLSAGQALLFQNSSSETVESPAPTLLALPPEIIFDLIHSRASSLAEGERKDAPLPPESILTLNTRDGAVSLSTDYASSYEDALQSLDDIRGLLSGITEESSADPDHLADILEKAYGRSESLPEMAQMIRDVTTRYDNNEFTSIERGLNDLYDQSRALEGLTGRTLSIHLDGVMLGFNMAAINKKDPSYRSGTALKFLIAQAAGELAPRFGGKSLGLWGGTNAAAFGIGLDQVAAFHKAVQERVLAYVLSNNLPDSVIRQTGSSTLDAKVRKALLKDPGLLGLTAGHRSMEIDPQEVRPGTADLKVILLLQGMAGAESKVNRESGNPIFLGGDLDPEHPTDLRRLPLLRSEPILEKDASGAFKFAPSEIEPLSPETLSQGQSDIFEKNILQGDLPRPAHESGHSIAQVQKLRELLLEACLAARAGDAEKARGLAREALDYWSNPESVSLDQASTIKDFLTRGYERSFRQDRFPDIVRSDQLPQVAAQVFEGEKFYIQMAEYRDYWGHNRAYSSDAYDTCHRLTLDVLMSGYEYHGVRIVAAAQGDEVYFAIGSTTADGRELTDADISRITQELAPNFGRVFEQVDHHMSIKVPPLPGGLYEGKPYALQTRDDGRVEAKIQGKELSAAQKADLAEIIKIAHGMTVDPSQISSIESLSKIAPVERWRVWQRADASSGRVLEITLPLNQTPPAGWVEKRIPLSATLTPAVEIDAGSSLELVRSALDWAGELAERQKAVGADRPAPYGAGDLSLSDASKLPPVVRFSALEKLTATQAGRTAVNAGAFAAGDILSDALMGRGDRWLAADAYGQLAKTYLGMTVGTSAGETLARGAIAAFIDDNLLTVAGDRMVINGATFRAEAGGLRGLGIKGGGLVGAILLTELVASGRIDPKEAVWSGGSMLAAMGTSFVVGQALTYGAEIAGIGGAIEGLSASNPLVLLGTVVLESLVMKHIMEWRQSRNLEEAEEASRAKLSESLRAMDSLIATSPLFSPDHETSEGDAARRAALGDAVRRATQDFGDLLIVKLLHDLPEGNALLAAQSEYEETRKSVGDFLADMGPMSNVGFGSPLDRAIRALDAKQAELTEAEAAFKKAVSAALSDSETDAPSGIAFGGNAQDYEGRLAKDAPALYAQFQGYLASRMGFADYAASGFQSEISKDFR